MQKFVNSRHTLAMAVALALGVAGCVAYAAGDHAGGHPSKPGQMDPAMKGMNMKDQAHAAALGQPGDPAKVARTLTVEMSDTMRFKPARINVKQGETIRFVVKNVGKLKHEMVLGTQKELKEHADMMRKMPEMEHGDPNQVTVEPGKTGELVWQFTKAGSFDFACLQPGHLEAGMAGKINVAGK